MSNYGLACMILDLVKKDFSSDITSVSSLKSSGQRVEPDIVESKGDSSDEVVFSAKDDSGQLINCPEDGIESLNADELSQIEIVNQVGAGGDNIFFRYDDEEIGWDDADLYLGKGSFGEVKRFKLTGNKYVAIKKYPTWKLDDKKGNAVTKLEDSKNEGEILKKIDEKCGPGEGEGEGGECIRSCDIVPARIIKSSNGANAVDVFYINTELPGKVSKPMEYSFIAMEAMTGSLKIYSQEQKVELKKEMKSRDENKIRKLLDEIFVNVTKIILKVAKILKCLSDKGYYYPDLKSDNVLYKCVDGNIIIKMGDIGSLTTKDNMMLRRYVRTYYDPQSKNKWQSNLKYYHVYLLGYLYLEIFKDIFGVKFGQKAQSLQDYTKSQYKKKPNDKQIREDIENFMNGISTKIPEMEPKYNFTTVSYDALNCKSHPETNSCIGEEFSVLINEVLHKTIVSQLELSTKGQRDIEQAEAKVNDLSYKNAEPIELEQANDELYITKLKHSFRYNDESELIGVLENGIDKINMRMRIP